MTQTMPTDEQLKAYADKLPDIYKDVLSVYPHAAPNRRAEDPLTLDTLIERVVAAAPHVREADVELAAERLERRGFLSPVAGGVALAPTEIGERLITALTGHRPATGEIPELPEPTWG